jgi:hypothetical protein
MANTPTCFVSLNMEGSLPKPTISFWVITSIEANNLLRLFVSLWLIKSSFKRTSLCCVVTMNVHLSTVFMGSMMNARDDTLSNCGRHS